MHGQSRHEGAGARVRVSIVVALAVAILGVFSSPAVSQSLAQQAKGTGIDAANSPEATTAYRIGTTPWSAAISYNPYSPDILSHYNFVDLGLAVLDPVSRPGPNPYYPELAKSWSFGKHSVTLHLQPKATWQNGKPFTSTDIMTSLLMAGANYNPMWGAITSLSSPTPHESIIHLQPWGVPQDVFSQLLQIPIVPASQYGKLVPSALERSLVEYWKTYNPLHPSKASLDAATTSAAGKAISAAQKKAVSFAPKTMVGDGPYKLVHATEGGILYEKWNGWWDARAIRAPWVELLPMPAATAYGAILSGRVDQEMGYQYTDPQVAKLNHDGNGGHYMYTPAAVQQESLVFHLSDYPFNLLAVRQALADVIQRPKLARLDMGGELIQNPPTPYPNGINDFLGRQYMTPAQYKTMNPYSYSPHNAAALLRGAGFTKRSGTWFTPKGKPFAFSIVEPAGYAQFDEDGVIIAQMLKTFGIQASTTDVEMATWSAQQLAGAYAVSENFLDWEIGSPMADFAATFGGSAWNYPVWYNGTGSCGCSPAIGYGPTSEVPGLGKVNVAATLNREVYSAPPSTWAKYTYDWARWVNENLPILPLYNNAIHGAYDKSRYTHQPPDSQRWLLVAAVTGAAQTVLWQQEGYLKLKKS